MLAHSHSCAPARCTKSVALIETAPFLREQESKFEGKIWGMRSMQTLESALLGEGPVDESGRTLTMLLSNTGEMIYIPLDPL